jgi:predicted AAA+ superfamily ATPase
MFSRPFWLDRVSVGWQRCSIVWLSGVRRVGKTTLARMLGDVVFINCDLPSSVRRLDDPELFFDGLTPGTSVVFDEIHRIEDPSALATGSSTLAATKKFKDSLAGRKRSVYLSPVLWEECLGEFGVTDLNKRLLYGGLPEALLAKTPDPEFYAEWLDSFYARDIQELFSIRQRTGFLKLLRLLLRQSGGLLDFSQVANLSGLSRPTVMAHIEALAVAHAVFLLPPFHGAGRSEITKRPKAYGFDTGFVAYCRGLDSLRNEDRGDLWEHLVLDTLRSRLLDGSLHYWRDKSGREIDFVVVRGKGVVDTFECKINPEAIEGKNLRVFRKMYPQGGNYVVSPAVKKPYSRRIGEQVVVFSCLAELPM